MKCLSWTGLSLRCLALQSLSCSSPCSPCWSMLWNSSRLISWCWFRATHVKDWPQRKVRPIPELARLAFWWLCVELCECPWRSFDCVSQTSHKMAQNATAQAWCCNVTGGKRLVQLHHHDRFSRQALVCSASWIHLVGHCSYWLTKELVNIFELNSG